MLDPNKKVIWVSNVRWNKKKHPANTTPEEESCPKRVCLQKSNQPKASSQRENTGDSISFHPPDPASDPVSDPALDLASAPSESVTPPEEPTAEHLYATRSKTQSDPLGSMACFANAKDIDIAESKTYNKAAKCFEWKNWEKAMKEKCYLLHKNNTWKLVSWPLER